MIEQRQINLQRIETIEDYNHGGLNVSPIDREMQYALSGYIKEAQIKAEQEKDGICIAVIQDTVYGRYILAERPQSGVKFILFNAIETDEQEGAIKVILNSQDGTYKWVKFYPGGMA